MGGAWNPSIPGLGGGPNSWGGQCPASKPVAFNFQNFRNKRLHFIYSRIGIYEALPTGQILCTPGPVGLPIPWVRHLMLREAKQSA